MNIAIDKINALIVRLKSTYPDEESGERTGYRNGWHNALDSVKSGINKLAIEKLRNIEHTTWN